MQLLKRMFRHMRVEVVRLLHSLVEEVNCSFTYLK